MIGIFTLAERRPSRREQPSPRLVDRGTSIKGPRRKVVSTSLTYATQGNTAVDKDWSEF